MKEGWVGMGVNLPQAESAPHIGHRITPLAYSDTRRNCIDCSPRRSQLQNHRLLPVAVVSLEEVAAHKYDSKRQFFGLQFDRPDSGG
jgi:hypothetical protein